MRTPPIARGQRGVDAAARLPKLGALDAAALGESQRSKAALNLYHYVNPKLLVLTSAVAMALDGEAIGSTQAGSGRIQLGEPATMAPMEIVAEDPDDARLCALFAEIKSTLDLPSINTDYRALALWPDYLAAAWERLKPLVATAEYREAAAHLRETARALARELPLPFALTRERVTSLGEDAEAVAEKTRKIEELLPGLILNIALLQLDSAPLEVARHSPFPAETRGETLEEVR